MKLVKYQKCIRISKFCKVTGCEHFFKCYVSSVGLLQSGNSGAKLLISYTHSHAGLGHLEEFHLLLQGRMWMHKFTCRADILNFAAQVSQIWRHTGCFIPSSPLLADNKTWPAALVLVFFLWRYIMHVLGSRACCTADHGRCDELKPGDPGHISSFGLSSKWLGMQKKNKKRNHELSFNYLQLKMSLW